MKIVHLGVGVIPVPPGDEPDGIEEYIYQLTHHLGRLECEVSVIDIKGGEYQEAKRRESSAKFHEVCHLPLPHTYSFPFLQRFFAYVLLMSHVLPFTLLSSLALNRLLGREKMEIIHAHTREPAIAAVIVNRLRRNGTTVVIYAMHTGFGTTKLGWRKRLINFAEVLALKWADHIIADSPVVKRWLVSEFNLDPSKITPIYAVPLAQEEVEQFLSRKTGACHQSNMVLCVGSVSRRKNQFSAVKAIPKVVAECPEVKFIFAGPTAEDKYLQLIKKFIAENELSPWVEFKGAVTREELYELYSDATLFLFPTTAESRGDVLSEAMLFGLPVIASTIEPIADRVNQEEGSAILVDPYDVDGMAVAIIQLLQDSSLRQSISQTAHKLVRSLSWEHIAARTLALYEELVQNKKESLSKTGK